MVNIADIQKAVTEVQAAKAALDAKQVEVKAVWDKLAEETNALSQKHQEAGSKLRELKAQFDAEIAAALLS